MGERRILADMIQKNQQKSTVLLMISVLVCFDMSLSIAQQVLWNVYSNRSSARFERVFHDDFAVFRQDQWMTSYPWGRHLTGNTVNDESQEYYSDGKNMTVRNGIVSLEARKEKICGKCVPWEDSLKILKNGISNYRCFDYSSAMLYSKNEFGYGWYEIRFKQGESSKGLWPAFWLFGHDDEIDIFENKGERRKETHWDVHCKNGCKGKMGGWKKVDADFISDFNVVGLQWNNHGLQWYCNGQNYQSVKQEFNHKMNIIVNNAVSRSKDKSGFWVGPDASTRFPNALEVDYISYYKPIYTDVPLRKYASLAMAVQASELYQELKKSGKSSVNKKQDVLLRISYDGDAEKIKVVSSGKKELRFYIYNDEGKQLKNVVLQPGEEKIIDDLPDESLIIIAKSGKYFFTDKVNVKK